MRIIARIMKVPERNPQLDQDPLETSHIANSVSEALRIENRYVWMLCYPGIAFTRYCEGMELINDRVAD